MGRSTVHYTDSKTNTILKALHNKLRPAGTPVQRVEYIIELLLLRIFEVKLKREDEFKQLRKLFTHEAGKDNDKKLFYYLQTVGSDKILAELNKNFFPFYANILNHARTVIKGNLKDKVQDQLVLIQDVFANSNFTNNVQSGNLEEIVNLVADIDEERLLNTDLLGDAIESALSETGGTKDIGLFRTPDHVRQFMVGLLEPKITDNIFDPACGTGGFLFDSYGYVMEAIRQEEDWPGPKTHPELQEWFKIFFKKNPALMPTFEQTQQFYRSGIYGIEYLGMIRKMAAVNFYIRGLNPHNIEQGDSLAKFNKELQFKNNFSIVLANPPFGAERDQKAYPNVWEEFSKESETTILFVKLMLDALKSGGRCAVVVSEGFLTWDQTSAKTLRHMLLIEANLLAVIGLPQGVFVSKTGQGPKTSILVFEKGKSTKNVWFYNVENDGYTKGANRTPIDGCQLPEALELFHKYVRLGKVPPETRNSFSLSVDWLTVVDPRIKEKIRIEVTADIEQKIQAAQKILLEKLDKKKNNAKSDLFSKKEYDAEIYKFECVWQQKMQNEIAKRIDKAHTYSLNSSTYRSNLTEKQLAEWETAVSHHTPEKNGHSLDKRFGLLKQAKLENAINHIASFDPQNAIEADIVREYMAAVEPDQLNKYPALKTIDHIFRSGANHPMVKLKKLLIPKYQKIKKNEYDGVHNVVSKISFSDGKIHFREERSTGMDLYFANKGDLVTSKINLFQGALSLAPLDLVCSTHYQVYEIDRNIINPGYLVNILRSYSFINKLTENKNNGIKNEQGTDFLLDFEIPLPAIDEQEKIVKQIDKQKSVMEGFELISTNFAYNLTVSPKLELRSLGEAVMNTRNGWSPKCEGGDTKVLTLSCLKNGIIDYNQIKFTSLSRNDIHKYYVSEGDFFYSRGNTPELVALAGIAPPIEEDIIYPDLLTKVKFNEKKILKEYAVILFNSYFGRQYFSSVPKGNSPTMVKVSQPYMMQFQVPYMDDLKAQRDIVLEYNTSMMALRSAYVLKEYAKKNIDCLICSLWEEK